MKRRDAERAQALVEAIATALEQLDKELTEPAPRHDIITRTVRESVSRSFELRGRTRYLGWTTDDAILDYLADGRWRQRHEIVAALAGAGAPHQGTANRLRMLTEAGKLEKQDIRREDRGNPFGKWRLAGQNVDG